MTTNSDFDVVIIGAGHNGLIAGAYLAALGEKVCLVEAHSKVGGGVMTDEVTLPGFKHDLCSTVHHTIRENPLIKDDELGLQRKYGLEYIVPEVQRVVLFPGKRKVVMHKDIQVTCDYISQFSKHDAAEYPRFMEWATNVWQLSGTLFGHLFEPSPVIIDSLRGRRGGRLAKTARKWTELIKLSGPMLKMSPQDLFAMSTAKATDIYDRFFENEYVKAMLYKHCSQTCNVPYQMGTAGVAALVAVHDHLDSGGIPKGGSGMLTQVLARYVEDHGGTILVDSEATKVVVREGEAKGVLLRDGTELIASKAVISNINIKQLFLQLLEPGLLSASLIERVKILRHSTLPSITVHAATWQPPIFHDHPDIHKPMSVEIIPCTDSPLAYMVNHFKDIERGEYPAEPSFWVDTHTLNDPTRAPAGGHTVWVYGAAPYSLKDGGPEAWRTFGDVAAKRMWDVLTKFASNMRWDDIPKYFLETPPSVAERNPAMMLGDHEHLAMELDQMYGNRPLPELSDFTTPIHGLYLCGASISGGPVTGAGRAAAIAVAVHLGLVDSVAEFEKGARQASV